MFVRTLSLTLCFAMLCVAASACDVDLEKLLFGGKGEDPFFKSISQLASFTQSVGQAGDEAGAVQERLKTLMNGWIDFDNRYSRKPPEWASADQKWTEKIKTLTGLIGKLRQYVDAGQTSELHSAVTELHGRILQLVEAMPMPELSRKLLAISGLFCESEEAERLNNAAKMKDVAEQLFAAVTVLEPLLPEAQKKAGRRLLSHVENFKNKCASSSAEVTLELKMVHSIAADDFKKLNQALAGGGDSEKKE